MCFGGYITLPDLGQGEKSVLNEEWCNRRYLLSGQLWHAIAIDELTYVHLLLKYIGI